MINWFKKKLTKWLLGEKSEEEQLLDEKKRLSKGIKEYIELVDEVHSSLAKLVHKRLESTKAPSNNQEEIWKERAKAIRNGRF